MIYSSVPLFYFLMASKTVPVSKHRRLWVINSQLSIISRLPLKTATWSDLLCFAAVVPRCRFCLVPVTS